MISSATGIGLILLLTILPEPALQRTITVYSPFQEQDRQSYDALQARIVGRYGDWRSSYVPGHLHAGVDLKGDYEEQVHAIGRGKVMNVSGRFPNRSVIITHQQADQTWSYAIYTHLEEITVKRGDLVDQNTVLGRLFTADELERSRFGTATHLHLEIRKDLRDNGRASYRSMTRADLDRHCLDPLPFFQRAFNRQ
ncbi:M23 family metallopeptidase [Gemmatimonadota bacterium]